MKIHAVLRVVAGHAAIALAIAGRLLQLSVSGVDAAFVFFEVGGFAEGWAGGSCGIMGGYYNRGGSGYCDGRGRRAVRDCHCLQASSAGLGC